MLLSYFIRDMMKIILIFISSYSILSYANSFKIDAIRFKGLKKVEREALDEIIALKVGSSFERTVIREDIDRIYNLGHFDFVEVHHITEDNKNIIIFKVEEKPLVVEVKITGTEAIEKSELYDEIKIKKFSILDINTINQDLLVLKKYYENKGFYLVTIKYKIRKLSKENVALEFLIEEFEKVRVKKITILGNTYFTDNELKNIMLTKEDFLLSFMSKEEGFQELDFQIDIERMKYFYKMKGFLQVEILAPEVTMSIDKKWIFISLKINEGPQIRINKIFFKQNSSFEEKDYLKVLLLKEGELYSEEKFEKDIIKLTELYQDKGYAFANVLRERQLVPGENKIDIHYSFEKGRKVYFGRINIQGNTNTRDKIIRRELTINKGELFSGSKMRVSKRNIERLGFFKVGSVVFKTQYQQDKNILDVIVEVQERETGQISFGMGFASSTGFMTQASISQNNFLGRGQSLRLKLQYGKKKIISNIGFTEPYFRDTLWTVGGDIFYTKDKQSQYYEYSKRGGRIRVGHPLANYLRLFGIYQYVNVKMEEVSTSNGVTSSMQLKLIFDKRNNIFDPSGGYSVEISAEYAGIYGDKRWLRNEFNTTYFYQIIEDLVFRSRFFIGKLHRTDARIPIPRNEKYTLGGPRDLRGYPYESVGEFNEENVNIGTYFSSFVTFELEYPLVKEAGLRGVIFFDGGDAFDDKKLYNFQIKMNYGVGVRWFSPIGLMRFELGFPLSDTLKHNTSQLHFDLGKLF